MAVKKTKEIRNVGICPHCENRAPHTLLGSYSYRLELAWTLDGEGDYWETRVCFVAVCDTCDHILLYGASTDFELGEELDDEELFGDAELLWPLMSRRLHRSAPKPVAEIYNEARAIKSASPSAYAVNIRRALETICNDRGCKKARLIDQLRELAERGEIPPVLAQVTHILRVLGNIGAHKKLDARHVEAIDEFFHAVVEYIYVAPSKVREFQKTLDAANFPDND